MKRLTLVSLSLLVATACGGASEPQVEKPIDVTPPPAAEVKAIPDGFHSLTPGLVVVDIDAALAFYAKALGATAGMTLPGPDGKTMHAEMKIGDSMLMLSAEDLERGEKAPAAAGGTNGSLLVYVEDVDAAVAQAIAAGAKPVMPVGDMFWGDRYGQVVDTNGHMWGIATHKEDVADDEMKTRATAWLAAASKGKQYQTPAVKTPAKSFTPDGYHTVTVTLLLKGGASDLSFYTDALGAEIIDQMAMPDGKLMHASVKLGDTIFHLSSEFPKMSPTHKAAANLGSAPVSVYFYNTDVDASFKAAVAGGATAAMPVTDMFWGDRFGMAKDPSGNHWGFGTHKQDLTKEQIIEGMKKQFGGM